MKSSKILLFSALFFGILFWGSRALAKRHNVKPFAIGTRASPSGWGLTARWVFKDQVFLEGQYNWSDGIPTGSGKSKTGGLLIHYSFRVGSPRVRMYIGTGVHYGTWERYFDRSAPRNVYGFDGVIGTECIFPRSPFSLSVDFKPGWNFVAGTTFFPNNSVGLGLRYNFGHWSSYSVRKYKKTHKYKGNGKGELE